MVIATSSRVEGQPLPPNTSFGSKQPPLVLSALVEEALARNPGLQAERQEWLAKKSLVPGAGSLEDPSLGVTEWMLPANFGLSQLYASTMIWYGIDQRFPFPGKLELRVEQAQKIAGSTRYHYLSKKRQLVRKVKQAYYRLALAREMELVHLHHLELLKEFEKTAQIMYVSGLVPQQDALKASVEYAEMSNRLLEDKREEQSLRALIVFLLHRPSGTLLGDPRPLRFRPFPIRLDVLEDTALRNRPEISQAHLLAEAEEKRTLLAKKEFLPDFSAGLYYMNVNGGPNGWMIDTAMTLPWIFPSKHESAVRETAARKASLKKEESALRDRTLFEVKDLYYKIKSDESRVANYESGILPQAESSLHSSQIGYQSGKNDFLNLLDNERVLLELQLDYYKILADLEMRKATLEQIVGKKLDGSKGAY